MWIGADRIALFVWRFGNKFACFALAAVLLALVADVRADVQVSAMVGWQGPYRTGRWTPVFVTASSDRPRQVVLELYAATDPNFAMNVTQSFAIGPTPVTQALYVPLNYDIETAHATLRDAGSRRYLASASFDASPYAPRPLQWNQILIGVSGNESTARVLQGQLRQDRMLTGFLPQSYLPRVPIGYDALDLLVLDQPNFDRLEADHQRAIVQWVRGGGRLVIIAGLEPLPATGPLLELLPVKLRATRSYELPAKMLKDAGLPERFETLRGRAVSAVADGVITTPLFPGTQAMTYRQWLGFGQVMVIPADVSMLTFESPEQATSFWTRTLAAMVKLPAEDDQTAHFMQDDARRQNALKQAMNWGSDVPGAGQFGFSYLAAALLAMMLIVGPLDWFVLKWLGKQPWTWVTTAGWIGVVTLAAIYVGHIFKSGDLHFRSVTLSDEIDGMRVGQVSLASIYSPRTREYDLEFPPESWWQPASYERHRRSEALPREIDCHQNYRGNRPRNMLIHVWNLRFLLGEDATPTGAVVSAKLSRSGNELSGTITNQGEHPLEALWVLMGDDVVKLQGHIAPGATMPVSGTATPRRGSVAEQDDAALQLGRFSQEVPTTQPSLPSSGELASARTDRIDQLLRERHDVACVYVQFEAEKPLAAKLDEPEARQAHRGMIRAVVPLENK